MNHDLWNAEKYAVDDYRFFMRKGDGNNRRPEGYDGMYVIKPELGKIVVMGIGVNFSPKSGLSGISSKVTVSTDGDAVYIAKQLEKALCKVSKPFNIGFGY